LNSTINDLKTPNSPSRKFRESINISSFQLDIEDNEKPIDLDNYSPVGSSHLNKTGASYFDLEDGEQDIH